MCFFKSCGLLEGRWYLENARTCLLSVWGWPFGAFGVAQILLWGPGIKADCSERGTHLHACFNETFKEVWCWPIFLCLPPSKKYPVREAHGACEDGPWSFSCLWDVACFVFSAWLFFPPHPLVLKPSSFKHQHKCHKAFYSLIDHRATINLLPSCSPFISIFGSSCLCMGTCFPNLTFWCSL